VLRRGGISPPQKCIRNSLTPADLLEALNFSSADLARNLDRGVPYVLWHVCLTAPLRSAEPPDQRFTPNNLTVIESGNPGACGTPLKARRGEVAERLNAAGLVPWPLFPDLGVWCRGFIGGLVGAGLLFSADTAIRCRTHACLCDAIWMPSIQSVATRRGNGEETRNLHKRILALVLMSFRIQPLVL
jgi:hypothetical protein